MMMILYSTVAHAQMFAPTKNNADASSFSIGAHLPAMCDVVEVVEGLQQAEAEPRSSPRFILSS